MLTVDKEGTRNGRQPWLRGLAIALALLTVAHVAGGIVLRLSGCGTETITEMGVGVLSGLAFTAVGLLITVYHPRNRIGWIMLITGFGLAGFNMHDSYVSCHLAGQLRLPGAAYVAWFNRRWASIITVVPLFILLPFVFPTGATGQQSPLAIVISTLLIAALFNPLRRRVQDVIDRRFYRQKYDAQQVLARFAGSARDETDIDRLTAELGNVIQETLQPESMAIWVQQERSRQ